MAVETDSIAGTGPGGAFTYADALAALSSALTFGINPSLEPVTAMVDVLGQPHDTFASVQVTGTNGKSSTARLIAAIARAHGLRTGLYTSPELHSYTERIEVDGAPVAEDEFAAAVAAALGAAHAASVEPTEFEILTAAALWLFGDRGVDVAVLEVGMGGRWDATSVVSPAVAVVTGVAMDHAERLGRTRDAIAADKAHIIKPASTPVLGPGTTGVERALLARVELVGVHARAVRLLGQPTPVHEDLTIRYAVHRTPGSPDGLTVLDVLGAHRAYADLAIRGPVYQAPNVATAVAATEALIGRALDPSRVRSALSTARVPGRFEVVARDPWVVVDAAHNPDAAAVLAAAIRDAWPDAAARPTIVLGVLADKDAEGIAAALAPVAAGFMCAAPDSPRALPVTELAAAVERVTGESPPVAASVAEAVGVAAAANPAGVVVTGSIRTVAEGRRVPT